MILKPRETKLRADELKDIAKASARLITQPLSPFPAPDAFSAAFNERPRRALQRIKAAKPHLAKAEAALQKWAGR